MKKTLRTQWILSRKFSPNLKMSAQAICSLTELRADNRIALNRGYVPYLEHFRECFQSMQILSLTAAYGIRYPNYLCANPNGIFYDVGFRYLADVFPCRMLLDGVGS